VNIIVMTLIIFSSLMGIINAADELTGSPNSSHKANSGRSEHRPELLGDLTAKIMPIIQGLVEENKQLKDQLWRDHYFLWQTPVFPSRNLSEGCLSSGYQGFQGTEVDFVHKVFANLKKQLLAIITDLVEENCELKKLLVQKNDQAELSRKFKVISEFVQTIPLNMNVHALDEFVFGSQSQITNLLKVARHVNIDDGTLSWEQIIDRITAMLHGGPTDVLAQYEEDNITVGQFRMYVHDYFNHIRLQLPRNLRAKDVICEQVRELWSRTVSLSMIENNNDPSIFPLLVAMISENYLTEGNLSIGGKINRTFTRYVCLIGSYIVF